MPQTIWTFRRRDTSLSLPVIALRYLARPVSSLSLRHYLSYRVSSVLDICLDSLDDRPFYGKAFRVHNNTEIRKDIFVPRQRREHVNQMCERLHRGRSATGDSRVQADPAHMDLLTSLAKPPPSPASTAFK
jgi:hypothetical protein